VAVRQLVRASVEEAAAALVGPVAETDQGAAGQEVINYLILVSKLLFLCVNNFFNKPVVY
jgi:hypothetical protein